MTGVLIIKKKELEHRDTKRKTGEDRDKVAV